MAPRSKSPKAPASKPEPETKGKRATNEHRKQRQALRQKLYKKAKMAQRKAVFHAAAKSAGTKEEKAALRAAAYRRSTPKSKGPEKVAELEGLVKEKQAKARELKKQQRAKAAAKLEAEKAAAETPKAARAKKVKGSGSSPAKTRREPEEAAAEEAGAEPMEGVEEPKVIPSVEKDAEYPTLLTVEEDTTTATTTDNNNSNTKTDETQPAEEATNGVEDAAGTKADVPADLKYVARESSVDSNAGMSRNLRRSPRKRTKRRSLGGQ